MCENLNLEPNKEFKATFSLYVTPDKLSDLVDDVGIVKQEVLDISLAQKVDKVEGKSLVEDAEIQRLSTLENYNDLQIKQDISNIKSNLNTKVDKVEGKSLVEDTEIQRLSTLENYNDSQIKQDIYAIKSNLNTKVDKVEGKQLSTNDFTDTLKSKLDSVDAKSKVYSVNGQVGKVTIPIPDISPLATKQELEDGLATKQAKGNYASKSEVNSKAEKTYIDTELNKKADKTEIPDISNLATKDEIPAPYTLPTASTTILGGVKVDGTTITINNGVISSSGGSGETGTTNYNDLTNKPQINGVELSGNKTLDSLGIQAKGDYALKSEIPVNVSAFNNDAGYLTEHQDISNLATKSELDTKQDIISDLAIIREGASKGETALQSYTETDPVYTADKANIALKSEIPDISNLATKSELDAKQDTLVSSENIKTINGTSILGAGNIEIQGGGGCGTPDNYLPDGTTITVNLDGSGDFTDLPSAIDYLTDKFSSGTVTIQLGEGTFELSAVLTINTNKFTFGQLKIVGSGIDTTTIYKATSSEYTAMIYVQNSGTVYFQDFTIKSDNTNYGRGIEPQDFSNVVCDKLAFEGFAHAAIYVERGATCMLGKYINLKNCLNAVLVNGAWFTTMYGAIFNCTSGVTTIATVQQGGLVQLVRCYYTGSPSKAASQTIGSVSANGFITGSLTKKS